MRIAAVWGANGFIGRHLVSDLIKNGWQVRALVRDPESIPEEWAELVDIRLIDFASSVVAISKALDGVQVAYHCAGNTDHGVHSENFIGASQRFMESAIQSNVQRVIMVSTVAVYGDMGRGNVTIDSELKGETPYALARIAAENSLIYFAIGKLIKVYVVRIPMVVGLGMSSHALKMLFGSFIAGCFFHLGSKDAVLNCIGINRLSRLLLKLSDFDLNDDVKILQFSDNIRWIAIVKLYAELTNKTIWRIPVPGFFVKLASLFISSRTDVWKKIEVISNQTHFKDDTFKVSPDANPLFETMQDIAAYIKNEVIVPGSKNPLI